MKHLTILSKIENYMDRFTQAEKKIAVYIMEHAEIVPNLTTKDISNNTGASEASVVRFCKTIGIGSFKAFKIALVRDLTVAEMNINDFSVMDKKDTPYDLFNKVTYVNKAAIEATVSTLDKRELEKATDEIVKAKKIIFYGVGGSAVSAMDGAYKFGKIGYHAIMSPDFHMVITLVGHMEEGDIFVAVSNSGKTKDVLELARFAKKKGATIIAITKLGKSPLFKEADIKLCTPDMEQDIRIGSIASKMSQQNIIDSLYVICFNRIGNKVSSKLHEYSEEAGKLRR
ncbi:MurR/RpiR family transcriptional regulator [Bacillus sp. AFS088145]|uniref:MurR/RpiR family transcriptional regulator n=1 Tax=Bacillus sp. AFS088145 TaxID=2033514 RepID=UPI000BF89E4A|nr:MurR/RpiR family transcriptional regulator [Bacillus sp. AFS088145]PFH86924.1 MurR/RpiR family transcriptional regulator [Bacillus sp. AFS088145]